MPKILFLLALLISPALFAADDEEKPEKKVPAYISLGDAMVLNLTNNKSRMSFLQLKADVLIADDDSTELITTHIPAIRHQLILLLSDQNVQDMKTADKREAVRKQATEKVQAIIEKLADNRDIKDVLFSNFFIQ